MHTSVSRVAVISRISSWRNVGNPPVWHIMAWSRGECGSRAAGLWCVLELPVISEADSILELSLVKKEAMIGEWESCKPG